MRSRRHLILVLTAGAIGMACRPASVLALHLHLQDTPPPPMVLRSASGGIQEGGIGTYCWDTMCVDMLSTPFPGCPLAIAEGEALPIDVSALGQPSRLDYAIWDSGQDDPTEEPSRSGEIDVQSADDGPIPLALELPPGQYAIEIFGQFSAGGDSTQGFTLLVQLAGKLVTPEASPTATAAGTQDCEKVGA